MIEAAAIRKNGIIYTGRRHCEILCDRSRPFGFLKSAEQGFITDTGVFMNREEAGKHAFQCGQIPKLTMRLFSENIFKGLAK